MNLLVPLSEMSVTEPWTSVGLSITGSEVPGYLGVETREGRGLGTRKISAWCNAIESTLQPFSPGELISLVGLRSPG